MRNPPSLCGRCGDAELPAARKRVTDVWKFKNYTSNDLFFYFYHLITVFRAIYKAILVPLENFKEMLRITSGL